MRNRGKYRKLALHLCLVQLVASTVSPCAGRGEGLASSTNHCPARTLYLYVDLIVVIYLCRLGRSMEDCSVLLRSAVVCLSHTSGSNGLKQRTGQGLPSG